MRYETRTEAVEAARAGEGGSRDLFLGTKGTVFTDSWESLR